MPDLYLDHIDAARAELHATQRAVAAEIRAYPVPVAGCDAQFNHLLAERARIAAALQALAAPVFVPTPRQPDRRAAVEGR